MASRAHGWPIFDCLTIIYTARRIAVCIASVFRCIFVRIEDLYTESRVVAT